jgi:hypothetical protein
VRISDARRDKASARSMLPEMFTTSFTMDSVALAETRQPAASGCVSERGRSTRGDYQT